MQTRAESRAVALRRVPRRRILLAYLLSSSLPVAPRNAPQQRLTRVESRSVFLRRVPRRKILLSFLLKQHPASQIPLLYRTLQTPYVLYPKPVYPKRRKPIYLLGAAPPPGAGPVPNVIGFTLANAVSAIVGDGLSVGTQTFTNSATVPVGCVVSQNPLPGSSVAAGTPVNLVLSLGAFPAAILSGTQMSMVAGSITATTNFGIYDYFSLAQALLDFSHRNDIANFQDYFILGGEQRIYNDVFTRNFGNGVLQMEQVFTGTIGSSGTVALPSGYIQLKGMQVGDGQGNVFTLLYKDPQWIYSNYPIRQPAGIPAYVARDGSNFVFGPYPDSQYSLTGTYYAESTPLSSSNTTTWMTVYIPDILLAACMIEAQPFLKDPQAAGMWQAIYDQKLAAFVDGDKAEGMAPGSMTMEVE